MIDLGESVALLGVWLGFMAVVGAYAVRIALMVRGQRIAERTLRLRLATLRGSAVRETTGQDER